MPLFTVDQAAERLGTSPRFIRRLIAERRIAFAKLGKHVRIDSADLDAFVAAGRVAPATAAPGPESRDATIPRACSAVPPVSPEPLRPEPCALRRACRRQAEPAVVRVDRVMLPDDASPESRRPGDLRGEHTGRRNTVREARSCHIRAIVSGETGVVGAKHGLLW
jgi:excisionase family DNA binding protein